MSLRPDRVVRLARWTLPAVLALGLTSARGADPARPVTPEEVAALAQAIEEAVGRGDADALDALIDWDGLMEAAIVGIEAPPEYREGFMRGARGSRSFARQLVANGQAGGSYRHLRVRSRGATPTAVFRLLTPEGAVTYHEYLIGRPVEGKARAVDLDVMATGELISATLRRSYAQGLAQQSRGLVGRLLGGPGFLQGYARMPEIQSRIGAGRFREALEILDGLPREVQDDKVFLIARIRASQGVDAATYGAAIERHRRNYPNDPSLDLFAIDGFTILKRYDEALAAVDRLDRSLGGDPYLGCPRAGILLAAGRHGPAKAAAEAAIEGVPDLLEPYAVLIRVGLEAEDYPGVLAALKRADAAFEIDLGSIEHTAEYAGFVESPQFAEWKAYLAAKADPDRPDRDDP